MASTHPNNNITDKIFKIGKSRTQWACLEVTNIKI